MLVLLKNKFSVGTLLIAPHMGREMTAGWTEKRD
jgi:hypothetical protein